MASPTRAPRPDPRRDGLARRTLLGAAGATGVAALLGACGGGGPVRPAGTSAPRTTAGRIEVKDQRGHALTLDRPARRVVTIPMPAASILVAVDRGVDHLVGMHQASWVAMRDGVLGQFFPQALKIPHEVASASFAPNVESVVALRPDLVVQWGDEGVGLTAPLENAGLDVLGLTYGTQADLTTWVTLFGTLLGKPQRATEILTLVSNSLEQVKALASGAHGPAPSVLYFNRFTQGLKVAGPGTYNDQYIRAVGATNPASGPKGLHGKGMVGVDLEQVLAWDPEIVLLGNFDAAVPSDVYGNARWRSVSAVRNHRVYKVPLGGYRWDPPSHESPLMWRWLHMVAFPDHAAYDLRAEVGRDYEVFYGRTPTPAQTDAILQLHDNDGSAHYDQFHAA